ncbi:hypothetical protein [Burkholderia ubonensis]|uniref:hypothetical protein n=1 Tax=Burkholderia ubonensis TaxID=101571 RepID=UPI00075A2A5E|nr:hypothetical protein [Burkholderia ubonensis]KVV07390.1 hypothetical protein WK77_16515 [Burkholderia ubonensis]
MEEIYGVVTSDVYTFKTVIAADRLPLLRENLSKLNKRAAKHGVEPFKIELGRYGNQFVENRSEGFAANIRTVEVALTGQRFRLGDYRVMASIDHKNQAFRTFGDFRIPGQYLACDAQCDHCKTKRDRAKTFLLADKNGDLFHIGSSCIESFTGFAPEFALGATSVWDQFSDMQEQLEEGDDGIRNCKLEAASPMLPFLAIVSRMIRRDGWVSSSTAAANRESGIHPIHSTSQGALEELKKLIERVGLEGEIAPNVDAVDVDVAANALAHARASYGDVPEREAVEAFDANMWSVSAHDAFIDRHAGFAAFIVRKYHTEVLEPNRAKQFAGDSDHVGTVKKREEFEVTLYKKILVEGAYGTNTLCLMHDQHGNQLRWMASGLTDMEAGKSYRVKATVKKHDEYKGVKQTALSRVSVIDKFVNEQTIESGSDSTRDQELSM